MNERQNEGGDRNRALLFAHQNIVEARAGKATQHRGTSAQRGIIRVSQAWDNPVTIDTRGRNLVLQHNLFGFSSVGIGALTGGTSRPRATSPNHFCTSGFRLRRIHITGEHQY
jgi:hypothetical protein